MLLFSLFVLFFFYFFSLFSMSIDVLPSQEFGCPVPPSYCVYPMDCGNKCPYLQQHQQPPKPEEPSPEVLEELAHQKEIRGLHYSTQKIVHEIQHAEVKLALLKLTKEIEHLSQSPLVSISESEVSPVPEPAVEQEAPITDKIVEKGELEV